MSSKGRFILTGFKRLFDSRPVHAQLVLTYECNLSCGYCHEFTHGAPVTPYEVIVRRIEALGAIVYDLLGGDPLRHPRIVDIVRRVKATNRGVNFVTLITNAFKLTPAPCRCSEPFMANSYFNCRCSCAYAYSRPSEYSSVCA